MRWVHRDFYRDAPEKWLRIEHSSSSIEMVPGEFRGDTDPEVSVGRHLARVAHTQRRRRAAVLIEDGRSNLSQPIFRASRIGNCDDRPQTQTQTDQ